MCIDFLSETADIIREYQYQLVHMVFSDQYNHEKQCNLRTILYNDWKRDRTVRLLPNDNMILPRERCQNWHCEIKYRRELKKVSLQTWTPFPIDKSATVDFISDSYVHAHAHTHTHFRRRHAIVYLNWRVRVISFFFVCINCLLPHLDHFDLCFQDRLCVYACRIALMRER